MIKVLIIVLVMAVLIIMLENLTTDYDKCYSDKERQGYAAMGCCGGMVGGTRATEYLSESCIDCPYLILSKNKEAEEDD